MLACNAEGNDRRVRTRRVSLVVAGDSGRKRDGSRTLGRCHGSVMGIATLSYNGGEGQQSHGALIYMQAHIRTHARTHTLGGRGWRSRSVGRALPYLHTPEAGGRGRSRGRVDSPVSRQVLWLVWLLQGTPFLTWAQRGAGLKRPPLRTPLPAGSLSWLQHRTRASLFIFSRH